MGHTKCVQNVILVSQNAQFGSKWGLSIRTIGGASVADTDSGIVANLILHDRWMACEDVGGS